MPTHTLFEHGESVGLNSYCDIAFYGIAMHFMKSIPFYQCCICCISILVHMTLFLLYEKEYKSTSLQSLDYLLVQKPLSYPFLFQ